MKVTQSCLTLCDPMDYTVHGILQARILEQAAFPFSRGSSPRRNWTGISCIAGETYQQRSCGRLQKWLPISLNACSLPFVCVEHAALVLATWLPLVNGILTNMTQADLRCACIRGFSCFCNLPWLWQPACLRMKDTWTQSNHSSHPEQSHPT